ncbi:MAG: hypothetical protein BWY83_02522 [bacterium ADurb.Bin478]|nr:MAG: hypothetical protein BWY83_02522 [bacterium ADurb.Bin478]
MAGAQRVFFIQQQQRPFETLFTIDDLQPFQFSRDLLRGGAVFDFNLSPLRLCGKRPVQHVTHRHSDAEKQQRQKQAEKQNEGHANDLQIHLYSS